MKSGPVLTDNQIDTMAWEIIDVFKIWDISRTDSYKIFREAMYIAKNDSDETWVNPIKDDLDPDKLLNVTELKND
jgi:hypothetical protein